MSTSTAKTRTASPCKTRLPGRRRLLPHHRGHPPRRRVGGLTSPRKQYKNAIAALGLSQVGAARFFGSDERTGQRWAANGPPARRRRLSAPHDRPRSLSRRGHHLLGDAPPRLSAGARASAPPTQVRHPGETGETDRARPRREVPNMSAAPIRTAPAIEGVEGRIARALNSRSVAQVLRSRRGPWISTGMKIQAAQLTGGGG